MEEDEKPEIPIIPPDEPDIPVEPENPDEEFDKANLSKRVRAVLGVPENFLEDDVICSPVFIEKTKLYITKQIKPYSEQIEDKSLLEIAGIYYIGYLLCVGMDARLPKQMENLSTKTILQSIDWDKKALELLEQANAILDDILSEFDDELYTLTIAELSDETSYPESNI